MNESEIIEVDQLECHVCGERCFQEREGFYYCNECGTKKEQLRAVEISAEDTFNDTAKHTTQRTIKKPKIKPEENDITSWEFYNYVLRGFLQELIQMGAKPELKLMTLQVWAAYMGRMEVAFCKNNEMGLPKLNVRALQRDARIIYNHKQNKRKRERKVKRTPNNVGDERSNWREWRKTKRKLDESDFTGKLGGVGGALSESTLPSTRGLKLQWSSSARRALKRQMPLKHLDKHSVDSSGSMHCHRLHPKASSLNHFDRNIYSLNISKLYVVLAIALNQVEDNIQLTDLLRFIDEEHLTSRYMLSYLPENVARDGKTLIKQMEIGHHLDKVRYRYMRLQISQMSRFIDLNGFQKPDLMALTERYVLELNLPSQISSYVGCLMRVMPPAFEPINGLHSYPRYEARVMAYIIYVMKLLFGLDDNKEKEISASAVLVNAQISELNKEREPKMAPLFVYNDWMQFVEMRKILIANYSESFAKRFGVQNQVGRKVEDFLQKEQKQREQEYNYKDMVMTPAMQRMQINLRLIFDRFQKEQIGAKNKLEQLEFQPSLTPAHSYFKKLLLYAAEDQLSVEIPDLLYVDHSQHQVEPFKKQTKELEDFLKIAELNLKVEELPCQLNFESVGIFKPNLSLSNQLKERRANCDIKTETWLKELRLKPKRYEFVFRQPVANYCKMYQQKIKERSMRRELLEQDNPYWQPKVAPKFVLKLNHKEVDLSDLTALQIFDESHMEPLKVPLKLPRRTGITETTMAAKEEQQKEQQEQKEPAQNELPNVSNLKEPVQVKLQNNSNSTNESTELELPNVSNSNTESTELLLKVSNFDCWLLHGYVSKIRETDKQKLRSLFPCSFRWLLETCAATIGVDWDILYEQLLVLEVMFHHGIEDWQNHNNYLSLKYNIMNKDMNLLIKAFRDMW